MSFNLRLSCLFSFMALASSVLAQNSNSFNSKEQFVQLRDFSSKVKYPSIWGYDPTGYLDSLKLKDDIVIYDIAFFTFQLQPLARWNWRFQNGQVDEEKFNYQIKTFRRRGVVKSYSSPIQDISKSAVTVLFGFDKSKHLFMVADNNNNQRFDDDKAIGINYKSAVVKDKISFNIPYSDVILRDSNQMVKTSISVTINLNLGKKRNYLDIRKLIKDSYSWLEWSNNNSSVGELTINNRQYTVFVKEPMSRSLLDENESPLNYLFDSASHIVNTAINLKNEAYTYFLNGDIVLIDGSYYKFEFADWNLKGLKITEVPPGHYLGSKPGFFIKDFTVRDYEGAEFQFSSLPKGKFHLLDFWGSWCEPCIKKLPDLQQLYKTSKDSNWPLEIVSIAFDPPSAIPKLKQFKQDYHMDWRLFYENKETMIDRLDTSPIEQVNIHCYPSFILVGPDGKILVRGCGEEGLGWVKEYLTKEFKMKE